MNRLLEILKTLIPIIRGPNGLRVSKESTLHLVEALLGILIFFGYCSPGEVDLQGFNSQLWQTGESIAGLWIMLHGLAANFRRHREQTMKPERVQ